VDFKDLVSKQNLEYFGIPPFVLMFECDEFASWWGSLSVEHRIQLVEIYYFKGSEAPLHAIFRAWRKIHRKEGQRVKKEILNAIYKEHPELKDV